jgi:copper chaperone CopZ
MEQEHRMVTHVFRVPDVSCEHCVRAISTELKKIDGVGEVEVNLERKLVTVQAAAAVSEAVLREGIEEAGYDIAA